MKIERERVKWREGSEQFKLDVYLQLFRPMVKPGSVAKGSANHYRESDLF